MKNDQEFIERRIATGLIISTDYIQRIQRVWNPIFLESPEFRIVAEWCLKYFQKYKKAPDTNIESLYLEELRSGKINKAYGEYIEELLSGLSEEYDRDSQFNSAYLYDQTVRYFKAQELEQHNREVKNLIDAGEVEKAEALTQAFRPTILEDKEIGLDLSSKEIVKHIERAFAITAQPVLQYPGALGEMWNGQLIRGAFFAFLAPEKRGKSFMLMEMGLRAIRQKSNVAFFEAGDMTEDQILKRICIYIAQRSDNERYCQERFRPVGDCICNQLDTCTRKDRNCDHGIYEGIDINMYMKEPAQFVDIDILKEKYKEFTDYEPCKSYTCDKRKGTIWIEQVKKVEPLNQKAAAKKVRGFFRKYKRRFKLVCYPAGTLSVTEIRKCLDIWERQDGFVPDIIVIDYADLLSADDGHVLEFRHRQDFVWKNLRALSQERHVLLLTATQADAESYKKGRITMSNFSEDKRKLSHVTAQYGLNQDPEGREKKAGIMRINEIVVREGEFSNDNEVCVLQDLAAGRPFTESFWKAHYK